LDWSGLNDLSLQGMNIDMTLSNAPMSVVLIAIYRYQNFPIRIMHSLLEKMEGVNPHSIFLKNTYTNAIKYPTAIEEKLLREKIIELNPKVVGISVYSPFVSVAQRISQIVKSSSSALLVWGGIHPTLSPETCIKEADILCLGEGEGAFSDLIISLRDGNEYQNIENLWVNNGDMPIKNSLRPLIQDLDSIPFPAYARDSFSFINANSITKVDPVLMNPIIGVMPARGCPFRCSYCVNSLLRPMYKNLGHYIRRRSVVNVINEMKEILNIPGNQNKVVEFHDENFGTDESWLREFERLYPSEIGLPFKIQYNPMLIKPKTIGRLAKCGLRRIKFGIESGADHIRNKVFCRPGKNIDFINLINEISQYKVKIRYDLIVDNPYDTEESLTETIHLLLQLPKPRWFNLFSLQYFPGYPLTLKARDDGHITEKETRLDSLEKKMARNWGFVPRLFPIGKKQILQNIIWLIAYRDPNDDIIEKAVFSHSLWARMMLVYLNIDAFFWGRIQDLKRRLYRKPY
jgi:radical SAM superfamily enzyme YgiQ (UPF0313 family)